ncbi:helix-turn-helix domain-containing protein [Myroides guanonis]|uniref:HTH araC/xylS-type domain-containing protein n=1 Tax=Myroides guanonis TaxID=1150112 RepID=A0A1I3PPF2_9FLAO|nr:AraC family transcriptional regulator [Myroides guanonis]SFJ23382.1 hypothetical protein SAMN04487893_104197 [Myroides guanonis]
MKTILYEYLRKILFRFWIAYTSKFIPPDELLPKRIQLLSKNGSQFIGLLLEVFIGIPWFRSLNLSSNSIHNEHICYSIYENEIHLESRNTEEETDFQKLSLQYLKDRHTRWTKESQVLTPIQSLLPLSRNRVIGLLGFYIYDNTLQRCWVFLYNLDQKEKYSHKEVLKYHSLPNRKEFEKAYSKIPMNQIEVNLEKLAEETGLSQNELEENFKYYAGFSIDKYHKHNRLLEGLYLHIFSNLRKNEISDSIGFNSRNSYYKAFKTHFQKSYTHIMRLIDNVKKQGSNKP